MAKDAYLEALKGIKGDKTPVALTTRTRAQIEADIAEVSAILRGHLSNTERLLFVEDKQSLRKELATLDAAKAA